MTKASVLTQFHCNFTAEMFVIFVALTISVLIYHYLRWNYDYWKARGVPYEKPVVYFGNFKESMMRKRHVSEDFSQLY